MDENTQWRPAAGQIAHSSSRSTPARAGTASPGWSCPGTAFSSISGASPRPGERRGRGRGQLLAPDALYRLFAKAHQEDGGLMPLDVSALERVQRRANPRVQVVLPVRLGVGDQAEAAVLSGETVDLSTGGCRVMTDRPWPTEADPMVTIDLPDGEAVSTQARVVTVDLNGDGWEYRLALPVVAEHDAERLSRLVALEG